MVRLGVSPRNVFEPPREGQTPEIKDSEFLKKHPTARIDLGVGMIGAGVGIAFLGNPVAIVGGVVVGLGGVGQVAVGVKDLVA